MTDLVEIAERAIEEGRAMERAAIVEWLRSDADAVVNEDYTYHADAIAEAIMECAQAIAMGEHLRDV